MHKITNLWKFELNWSSELGENDERKNTLVGRICIILVRNYLFLKNYVTSGESFPKMFYTTNSSPMLVTKSAFKLIFVLSNYQTCTFPFISTRTATITFKEIHYWINNDLRKIEENGFWTFISLWRKQWVKEQGRGSEHTLITIAHSICCPQNAAPQQQN